MADLLVRRCIVLVAALIGCAPGPAPVPDLPLVGSWVRVYPPDGALDTLVLHANGAVAGSTRGLGTYDFKLARWKIGHKLMPGGLAVGDGTERAAVMAYVVSGDTLWLAYLPRGEERPQSFEEKGAVVTLFRRVRR